MSFAVGGAAWCAAAGVCKRAAAGVRRLARAMASARRLVAQRLARAAGRRAGACGVWHVGPLRVKVLHKDCYDLI